MKWLALLLVAACGSRTADPELVDVKRADLVVTVDVTGDLAALDATDVKPPAINTTGEFKVASLAAEGSDVKAGDPLVTLDASDLDRNLESAKSDVAEAVQRLARRRQEVALARREDELRLLEAEASARKAALKIDVPPDLVASIDLRQQQLDNELAKMDLAAVKRQAASSRESEAADLQSLIDQQAAAQRRVDEIERDITALAITAPRAGTVVYPEDYAGQKRKVGDAVYRSTTILQVVGLGAMVGNGTIDEIDIARIAVHQPVTLKLDALPDLGLHGTLDTVATSVQGASDSDPNKTVRVTIAIPPTRGAGLRPGMRFRGQIETARIPEVLQVSADAVVITAGGPIVYRETGGHLERVPLVLGRRTSDAIEIISGLAPGDRVSRGDPEEAK